ENLSVGCERVTRQIGMDKDGISNAAPCACPVVSHTRANPPYHQRGGADHENREKMYSQEVIASCNPEDASVDVIYPRRLRIDGCVVNIPAVQNVARDRTVIIFVCEGHRRQERGRTKDDDKRDDDDSDPTALTSCHE